MTRSASIIALAGVAAVAGCGGSGGGSNPSVPVAPSAGAPAAAVVPAPASKMGTATFVLTLETRSAARSVRAPQFLVSQTQSVAFAVTNGGTTSAPVVLDTTSASANCTTSGSMLTCSAVIPAPIGADTFSVTTYAQTKAQGAILATGTVSGTVVAGQANSFPLTLSGVPSSVTLALGNAFLPTGIAGTTTLTVAAKDAAGNTIVGPYGTPVSLSASGAVTLSTASVTASGTTVNVTFSGAATSAQAISGSAGTATAAASIVPTSNVVKYPIPSGTANGFQIVQGPDKAIYFGELGPSALIPATNLVAGVGPGKIGRLDPGTGAITELTLSANDINPVGLLFTPDGALWVGSFGGLTRVTSTTAFTDIPLPAPVATPPNVVPRVRSLTLGSDGRVWFGEIGRHPGANDSRIGAIPATGPYVTSAITEYTLGNFNAGGNGLATGADGNVYLAELNVQQVAKVTPSGGVTNFPLPNSTFAPRFIATGPDGNLYLTGFNFNGGTGLLAQLTPSGNYTFGTLIPNAAPDTIVLGSNGTLAFSDLGLSAIGRITLGAASPIQEWPVQTTFGASTSDAPNGIVQAADGSYYYTTTGTTANGAQNVIGRLILAQGWTIFPNVPILVSSASGSTPQLIGIAESGESGPFTAVSANTAVATVASIPNYPHDFFITGVSAGTTSVTVTDAAGRTSSVQVTVSATALQSTRRNLGVTQL